MEYREKVSSWFGKGGMSQEVEVFSVPSGKTTSDNQQILQKYVYLTMLDQSSQDIHAVVYLNGNATCYSGGAQIYLTKYICQQNGFTLKRIDFNETGKGKNQCDRESACMKTHRNHYISAGNNVTTAFQMKQAAEWSGGVKGTKVSVVNIEENDDDDELVVAAKASYYRAGTAYTAMTIRESADEEEESDKDQDSEARDTSGDETDSGESETFDDDNDSDGPYEAQESPQGVVTFAKLLFV
ncbi:unnamed protein product [Rotaria sp. Silwood2]|nr:unnamed protein product [Rotaria sp. Silwood2]